MVNSQARTSKYLKHLPALLQEGDFLRQFLLAFEHILSQRQIPQAAIADSSQAYLANQPAIGEMLDAIYTYFDPATAPAEYESPDNSTEEIDRSAERSLTIGSVQPDFLPWLASWVALTLSDDWAVPEKSKFIREIIPLYRFRGTKVGMESMLRIYINPDQKLNDVSSTLNSSHVRIEEFSDIPYYFQVEVNLSSDDLRNVRIAERIAQAIIDQEKPAYTYYALRVTRSRS